MTTLENKLVGKTRHNGIALRVSGDLSHDYSVLPNMDATNVGLAFPTKTMAIEFARKTGHLGWTKQIDLYEKNYRMQLNLGYLPENLAVKYAAYAYGEYAEKIRAKYGIKEEG